MVILLFLAVKNSLVHNEQFALEYYVHVLLFDQVRVTGVNPFRKCRVLFIYLKRFYLFVLLHLSVNQQKTNQRLL